jgi:hypothetical protein
MAFSEKILEGRYLYLKNSQQYSEENFTLEREDKNNGNYTFTAEILSRVSTGEFLKVMIDYEVTHQFEPLNIRIKRMLGQNQSTERYSLDSKEKILSYSFDGRNGHYEFEKSMTGRFHISTPAFCTSTLMTLFKKIDPVQRTAYNVISSSNIWDYNTPFHEHTIWMELKSPTPVELTINNKELQANLVHVIEDENGQPKQGKDFSIFYLSKNFNLPYKATFGEDVEVVVDKLKILEVRDYKKMF